MRLACELCGAEEPVSLNEQRDGVDIVCCGACGLVWNRAMPEPDENLAYYEDAYRTKPVRRRYLLGMLARGKQILDFLGDDLPVGGTHLDIGCAEGTLLALTRLHGLDVTGVEVDKRYSRYAIEERQLAVHVGELAGSGLAPASFDLVSLVHVIEHLYHPVELLREALSYVKPGGLLYIEVPNLAVPWPHLDRFFFDRHNFYFSAGSLQRAAVAAGGSPERLGCGERDGALMLLVRNQAGASEDPAWRDQPDELVAWQRAERSRWLPRADFLRRKVHRFVQKRAALAEYGDRLPELAR